MEPLCDLVCCQFVLIFDYFFCYFCCKKRAAGSKILVKPVPTAPNGHTFADGTAVGTGPSLERPAASTWRRCADGRPSAQTPPPRPTNVGPTRCCADKVGADGASLAVGKSCADGFLLCRRPGGLCLRGPMPTTLCRRWPSA